MQKKSNGLWRLLLRSFWPFSIGAWAGEDRALFGITYFSLFNIFGTMFLNALTLIVVPLVSSSIISGVARIGNEKSFGRLGGKMFAFYLGTSLLAVLIGLFFVDIIAPGASLATNPSSINQSLALTSQTEGSNRDSFSYTDYPAQYCGCIFSGTHAGIDWLQRDLWICDLKNRFSPIGSLAGILARDFQAMIRITQIIMKFLPYGVFCLVAKTFATTGFQSLHRWLSFLLQRSRDSPRSCSSASPCY